MSEADILFSDDKARLQTDRVHAWLASTYWSPGIARERVERAIARSHCVGAYRGDVQLGFARVVTDHATFAWLADVFVDPAANGQGIARGMTRFLIEHPELQGLRRWMLATRDAHGVYSALGFTPLPDPSVYMEITAPSVTAWVSSN